ncbi:MULTISPECIES: cobyrinate a,c-diamide synthase [Pseudanabaena]|uniref:Cobyrinate a,c-diamide synthase n=2 Tax=Pseudanabaena TaxID=1152 RepID=L8N3W1_9CYAN|nr:MULTISPECIES: cobyrinate a,c-diamide synthase [Pseudanabaena]ELS33410.1 Cobyrinic acid A,C-diamide synthase [Pseudanabaena biceps PCC 7429]MDG3494391.1 cobyrinate a,c-diamide synthase [Pseudanabaena catenata USMAC16]
MAIIIAGERSGVGKTTVTLALLAALKARSPSNQTLVQSFKVGPDYIDPMFHSYITGLPCRNLDPVLTSEDYVRSCFAKHSRSAEYSLIEGVMGLFDGATGKDDTASTAHIARLLNVPVVLILNCASTSRSIAAIAHGYRTFDPRIQIAGVVLNRVGSDRHLELLTQALEPLNLPILGVLRRQDNIAIPDRHLGLIPTAEMSDLNGIIDRLAYLGETCFDWEKLLPLMGSPHPLSHGDRGVIVAPHLLREMGLGGGGLRIAIAQDKAFSFYYADNLDLFREMGAELVPWSPISDRTLPENIQGLYFGGGFPEVFAAELTENKTARESVYKAIAVGVPTYAECGGLMYLCDHIVDFEDKSFPMVNIFATAAKMGKRLTLGYRQAIALRDSPLVKKGDQVWGHEFHRSSLTEISDRPLYSLQGYDSHLQYPTEGWQKHQVHASYNHLHFGSQRHLLSRFLVNCQKSNN